MQETLKKVMKEYGQAMTIVHGISRIRVRALVQQTYYKSVNNMEKYFSPAGVSPKSQYVYMGPLEPAVCVGDYLITDKNRFYVKQVQTVMYQNKPVYMWGLCVDAGG